eukprot:scaffold4471_cov68-Cyclotella_meneghiniana.AAC.3
MPREEGSSVAHEGMIEVENEEERVALMMVMGRIGRLDERLITQIHHHCAVAVNEAPQDFLDSLLDPPENGGTHPRSGPPRGEYGMVAPNNW